MKILHVAASLSPEWGGPVSVIKGLTEQLVRKGVEVTIFAPAKSDPSERIMRPEGTEVRLFDQDFLSRIWTVHSSDIAQALYHEASKFALIHIHEIWHYPHFAAYRAAKGAGKPYIVTIHGALEPWALNYKFLKKKIYTMLIQKRILREAAALHAITAEEIKHIRAFGLNNHVAVIPNGLNPEEFQNLPSRRELEGFYPKIKDKKIILFLGRIHPIKGLDVLAKAFGRIAKDRDDMCLIIVGPDSEGYQARVEVMLSSENILNKTIFTGMLTERRKRAVLGGANLLVLPSYSEVRGIVVLEAMICRLPVIITRQCNFPEVAEAGAGLIIEPNADQLAKALLKILNNPQLCWEMGERGRRLVLERFTWDKISDQMIQLYKDVLKGKISNRK